MVILGLVIGLLIASAALNVVLLRSRASRDHAWQERVRHADDARHASELRSAEQIDAILDRISTSPRLEVLPVTGGDVDPDERKHFSDFDTEIEQDAWNEYRGEPVNE